MAAAANNVNNNDIGVHNMNNPVNNIAPQYARNAARNLIANDQVNAVFGMLDDDRVRVRNMITAFQERIADLEQTLTNSRNEVIELQATTRETRQLRRENAELRHERQTAIEERNGAQTLLRAASTRTNNLLRKVETLDARATRAEEKVVSLERQLEQSVPTPPSVVIHQTTTTTPAYSSLDEENDYEDYFEGGDYYQDALYYRSQMRKWRARALELVEDYEQLEEDFERCAGDHYTRENETEYDNHYYDEESDDDDDESDNDVIEVPTSGQGTGNGQYVLLNDNDTDSFIVSDSDEVNSDSEYVETDSSDDDDDDDTWSEDGLSDVDNNENDQFGYDEHDHYNGDDNTSIEDSPSRNN